MWLPDVIARAAQLMNRRAARGRSLGSPTALRNLRAIPSWTESRFFRFAFLLSMAVATLACTRESEPQIAPQPLSPTPVEEQHWFPAAMGAVLVPSICRATCTRSCDFDFGTFECTGLSQPAQTYGGPEISVGTLLDERDSVILGG